MLAGFDFAAAGDMAIMYKSSKQNEAGGRLCEACAAIVLAIASEQEISTVADTYQTAVRELESALYSLVK